MELIHQRLDLRPSKLTRFQLPKTVKLTKNITKPAYYVEAESKSGNLCLKLVTNMVHFLFTSDAPEK